MIRIALVGCSNVSAYDRLVARCSAAKVVAAAEGAPPEFENCDAAIIESSLAARADLCVRAAEARKHILVASPFARTIEDADRAIEACRAAGVCLMVEQRKRFLPAVTTIRRSLVDGKLGELGLVRIHRWDAGAIASGSPADSSIEAVVDEIDLVRWLFGSPPATIRASGCELGGGSYVQIHFGFDRGGMALIDYAPALPGARGYFSLGAIGSTGAAYADDHHNTHLLFRDGDPSTLISGQEGQSLQGLFEEFTGAISESRDPAITGADGRDLLEISIGIQRSLTHGCPVTREGGSYEPIE